jgi:hypothetical protein
MASLSGLMLIENNRGTVKYISVCLSIPLNRVIAQSTPPKKTQHSFTVSRKPQVESWKKGHALESRRIRSKNRARSSPVKSSQSGRVRSTPAAEPAAPANISRLKTSVMPNKMSENTSSLTHMPTFFHRRALFIMSSQRIDDICRDRWSLKLSAGIDDLLNYLKLQTN